jgi:Flp pilus assembly pilin Flp
MSRQWIKIGAETGQTMAEYTLILGMITIGIVTAFSILSDAILNAFLRTIEIIQTGL